MPTSTLSTMTWLLPAALLLATACTPTLRQPAPPAAVQAEANRQLALRYFNDMWNRLDPAVADQIIAPDVVGHVNARTLQGIETLRQRIASIGKIYAPMRFTVESVVAEGDRIAVRWTQHATHTGAHLGPATAGKSVTVTGMNMFRVAAGRIAEIWVNADDLGELEQLGLPFPPGV
jgi:predicted ester cyclase